VHFWNFFRASHSKAQGYRYLGVLYDKNVFLIRMLMNNCLDVVFGGLNGLELYTYVRNIIQSNLKTCKFNSITSSRERHDILQTAPHHVQTIRNDYWLKYFNE